MSITTGIVIGSAVFGIGRLVIWMRREWWDDRHRLIRFAANYNVRVRWFESRRHIQSRLEYMFRPAPMGSRADFQRTCANAIGCHPSDVTVTMSQYNGPAIIRITVPWWAGRWKQRAVVRAIHQRTWAGGVFFIIERRPFGWFGLRSTKEDG